MYVQQYQWQIDGDESKIHNHTYTMQHSSLSIHNVTCEVYATYSNGNIANGINSITFQTNGEPLKL